MTSVLLPLLLLPLALMAPTPARAQSPAPAAPLPAAAQPTDNCGPIRQQIEARFRAGGVQPVLAVVETGLNAGGRVVGTCGNGRRQIVQLGAAAVLPAAPAVPALAMPAERAPERAADREPADRIPTECKDGSIVIGPNCDDPRAVRMTSAELAASVPAPKASAADAPARPASR